MGTIRSTSFEKAAVGGGKAVVEAYASPDSDTKLSAFVSEEKVKSDRPELGSAKVVIAGGRGMKNGENFQMLYKVRVRARVRVHVRVRVRVW